MTKHAIGFKGLSKWLLKTASGQRFIEWFVRRNWRALLSTAWGQEFYDFVQRNNARDNADLTKVIVVEFAPPDYVVVYGVGVRCIFVKRLNVSSRLSELLEEELFTLELPYLAKDIYSTKNIIGQKRFVVQTVVERYCCDYDESIWNSLSKLES